MKKKILLSGLVASMLVSCGSSRPRYLRCPKGKRCVEVQLKKQEQLKSVNTTKLTRKSLNF